MKEFGKMYTFEFIEEIFNKYSISYFTENTLRLHDKDQFINDVY
jgi:hypothetical protein